MLQTFGHSACRWLLAWLYRISIWSDCSLAAVEHGVSQNVIYVPVNFLPFLGL